MCGVDVRVDLWKAVLEIVGWLPQQYLPYRWCHSQLHEQRWKPPPYLPNTHDDNLNTHTHTPKLLENGSETHHLVLNWCTTTPIFGLHWKTFGRVKVEEDCPSLYDQKWPRRQNKGSEWGWGNISSVWGKLTWYLIKWWAVNCNVD